VRDLNNNEKYNEMAGLGLLASGPYDLDGVSRAVAAGERPCSEFHALLSSGRFGVFGFNGATPGSGSPLKTFGNPAKARMMVRAAAKFDAVLAMGEDVGIPMALGLAAYGSRVPFYCIMHGTYFDNPKFRLAVLILRRLDHFRWLCLSRSLANRLVSEFGFPAERCHVHGIATDTDFFHPRPSVDPSVIASAGVVERDYETLFRAVLDLDVQVEVATNSSWTETFNMAGLSVPANVKAGPLPLYTGIRNLYTRAKFVVLPLNPVRFACGYTVIAEAMAMGKAVIASRNPGHSDLIIPGVTGIYVECGDVAGLKTSIMRLMSAPGEAEQMGQAGRARICEMGSMSRYREVVQRVMENMAEQR
jgi:glycosyltransferase involved in cell wall biosynthesis